MVYQTDNWIINIKPVFLKEIKGLFGNIYPDNLKYKKLRNFYLFYLSIYFLLYVIFMIFNVNSEEMKKQELGTKLTIFELNDQNNKLFGFDVALNKKNLLINFLPRNDNKGCIKQAASSREQFDVYADSNALIIGISLQSVECHQEIG